MADTRLKAVATAESPRTLSVGAGESATAHAVGDPPGRSGAGMSATVPCCAQRPPGLTHPFFAHTSPPQRPTSVRAGAALRSGAPRLRQWLRTGLPCSSGPVQALGVPRTDPPRVQVAHTPGMVPLGADRDRSTVETC